MERLSIADQHTSSLNPIANSGGFGNSLSDAPAAEKPPYCPGAETTTLQGLSNADSGVANAQNRPGSTPLPRATREQDHLRILLVDDHLDTLSILSRLLQSRGHRVDSAATGKEALEMLEAQTYDVLVSDIGLPDVNGLELMRMARSRGTGLKGIALSGFGMDADIAASLDAGYFAHLVKPVDWPKLDEAIGRCI